LSSEFQSPITIKIPIEVDIQGEDQVRNALGNLQGSRGTKGGRDSQPQGTREKLKDMFKQDMGLGKGTSAYNFLTNPKAGITTFLKGAGPMLMAIMLAYELAPRVAKLLTKRGQIFDLTFRNEAGTLNNILRNRQQSQEILAGMGTQVIHTTRAGTVDPRDSSNSYQLKNTDESSHERQWAIRDPYGV